MGACMSQPARPAEGRAIGRRAEPLSRTREPLDWIEIRYGSGSIEQIAAQQFVRQYKSNETRTLDPQLWGDQIDYMIIRMDSGNRTAKLSMRAIQMLEGMQSHVENRAGVWSPGYGSYMIGSKPATPYGPTINDLLHVESNMRRRRLEAERKLNDDEILVTCCSFPLLGCWASTWPESRADITFGWTRSLFASDALVSRAHPRFGSITDTIRRRRGRLVDATVATEPQTADDGVADAPGEVYMDATVYGLGCGRLRVTVQASCEWEARFLHDQLIPVAPVLMALTAASPVFRGRLADVDCHWGVTSAATDCRTVLEQERRADENPDPGNVNAPRYMPRPRCASPAMYLMPFSRGHNDMPTNCNRRVYSRLRRDRIDHGMALHVAHALSYEPVCVYKDQLQPGPRGTAVGPAVADLFETMYAGVWPTVRIRPPPPPAVAAPSLVGWRVEFAPCAAQFTDFENAAFACFVRLLCRAILASRLRFTIPISLVDGNVAAAQKIGAAANPERTMWFASGRHGFKCAQMSIDEIVNGRRDLFPGLVPLVRRHLGTGAEGPLTEEASRTIDRYLRLVSGRASGSVLTTAAWIRSFVHNHPEYPGDASVPAGVAHDLLLTVDKIRRGEARCPDLLGRGGGYDGAIYHDDEYDDGYDHDYYGNDDDMDDDDMDDYYDDDDDDGFGYGYDDDDDDDDDDGYIDVGAYAHEDGDIRASDDEHMYVDLDDVGGPAEVGVDENGMLVVRHVHVHHHYHHRVARDDGAGGPEAADGQYPPPVPQRQILPPPPNFSPPIFSPPVPQRQILPPPNHSPPPPPRRVDDY